MELGFVFRKLARLSLSAYFLPANPDPEIVTADTLAEIFVVFFFYDGETPPDGVFDEFNAIDDIVSSTQTQSYASLVKANNDFNVYGFRYLIRGTTLPNLPASQGTDLYNHHYNSWKQVRILDLFISYYGSFRDSIEFDPSLRLSRVISWSD